VLLAAACHASHLKLAQLPVPVQAFITSSHVMLVGRVSHTMACSKVAKFEHGMDILTCVEAVSRTAQGALENAVFPILMTDVQVRSQACPTFGLAARTVDPPSSIF